MTRFMIFFLPALFDLMLGVTLFVCPLRVEMAGESAMAITWVISTWALVYAIASPIIGRLVTPQNSVKFITFAPLAYAACALMFVLVPGINYIYPIVAFAGIATAMFFTPFQIFMKSVDRGRASSVARSTALYTLAWSSGLAFGALIAGWLWNETEIWQRCHYLTILVGLAIAIMVLMLKHHADHEHHDPEEMKQAQATIANEESLTTNSPDYESLPDLAWVGWISCGLIGCLTVGAIWGIFPKIGKPFNMGTAEQGTAMFILRIVQAFVGLSFIRGKTWMYRPGPLTAFGICGIGSLGLFAFAPNPASLYVAAGCLGVYSGSLFFFLVFHSVIHPTRSARYVSINEMVVGIGGVAGPVIVGVLTDYLSLKTAYLVIGIMVVMAVGLQVIVTFRKRKQINRVIADWKQRKLAAKSAG